MTKIARPQTIVAVHKNESNAAIRVVVDRSADRRRPQRRRRCCCFLMSAVALVLQTSVSESSGRIRAQHAARQVKAIRHRSGKWQRQRGGKCEHHAALRFAALPLQVVAPLALCCYPTATAANSLHSVR